MLLAIGTIAFSQEITVRFTGRLNDAHYCRLDKVLVTNLSQNWTETVSYPDTIIVLGGNNFVESFAEEQGLTQNVPNPFDCETSVELSMSQREDVRVQLLDASGKLYAEYSGTLDAGVNAFGISAAISQTYILNANAGNRSYSIRMVNVGSGCKNSIKYLGCSDGLSAKLTSTKDFHLGDNMRYIGYATIEGQTVVSNVVEQLQTASQQVILNFTHYVCPTVETLAATSISYASANLNGNITDNGGTNITEKGFYYGTSASNLTQSVTVGGDSFSCRIYDLTPSTTYYYKAFATNSAGTSTGTVKNFTTEAESLPIATTGIATNIRETEGTIKGHIYVQNGTITEEGFLFGTSENDLNRIQCGSGAGSGSHAITKDLIGLTAATTYYYKAYATNSAGTAYGELKHFTTTCACGNIITDDEGNQYGTVQIGEQCWMAQNLRTSTYPDGASIPLDSKFYPDNNSSNVESYGYLYTWNAAMYIRTGERGICPDGWHLPSISEWIQLTSYLRSQSQYQCGGSAYNIAKSLASTNGWNSSTITCAVGNTPSDNNSTSFSASPAGGYDPFSGSSSDLGGKAVFWSSTGVINEKATVLNIYYSNPQITTGDIYRDYGCSVRCVRDY